MMTAVLPLISPEKGTQFGYVAQGLMLVVSGVYYPVTVLPAFMQWIAKISPATYALRGERSAILDGATVSQVWGDLWPMMVIGVVSVPLGIWVFRRENSTRRGMGSSSGQAERVRLNHLLGAPRHEESHRPRLRLYLFLRFCLALPAWVVVAVYLVREAKLDPLQLVLMGTVMEAAVFVCEIPTGVVADLVSRRLSLGIAWLLQGGAWALAGRDDELRRDPRAWVVWGIGATFESGAFQAWITDEVGPSASAGSSCAARRRRSQGASSASSRASRSRPSASARRSTARAP
jgi:hypothetical protein